MNRQVPWLRVFVEGVVIVGSILMAFGLQAWWDERQERAEEIEALAQLLEEFKSNSSELVAIRAINLRSLSASRELLALSGRLGVPNSTRSTTELLLDFPTLQSYDPVLGTLNSLIASGRLGILQSDSLRAALSEWPSNVEDLATNEEWTTSFYFDRIWPYLAEGGVWLDALGASGRLGGGDNVPEPPNLAGLLGDPAFQELLAQRIYGLQFLLLDVDMVEARLERILGLIEAG